MDNTTYAKKLFYQADKRLQSLEARVKKLTRHSTTTVEVKKMCSQLEISKNRNVPVQQLDENGDFKTFTGAFEYLFPDQKIVQELEIKKETYYQDYQLDFSQKPLPSAQDEFVI